MKILAVVRTPLLLTSLLFLPLWPVQGGELNVESGKAVWQAGIDNVYIEWRPDGSWNRIYSRWTHPVAFSDRQGITKAQIIAEEKAKAAIVRFVDQHITSSRILSEVQNDMNHSAAVRTSGSGEGGEITKTSQREMIESLTEVTSSISAGRLKGVIVLERGYNKEAEEAWVEVGISRKTIANADSLKGAVSGENESRPVEDKSPSQQNRLRTPGSEVRRSLQKDW